MKLRAPRYIACIKWLFVFMVLYLVALFALAKLFHISYGRWTYTVYWVPAYLVNFWILGFLRWVQIEFGLPRKVYVLYGLCYLMFLIIGIGYDWVMIFAGTWYFDNQSVWGLYVIKGTDIFNRPCGVPLEELIFDMTFLPFGCLVVAAAFFKFYSILLVFKENRLHFKASLKYEGFQNPTTLRLVLVDDLDAFISAFDPGDEENYIHLIKKDFKVVEGTPLARLFPFIKF
jgi:hypothetical protein